MKLFLNNGNPVLTKEAVPSWHCPKTCCFDALRYSLLSCQQSFRKQCSREYSYTLQDNIYDIFKL